MNSAIERLLSLRVGDIMTRDVVQIPAHETMADAARLFSKHEITGGPVVDDQGRCVGVISSSDFVIRERSGGGQGDGESVEHILVQDRPGGPYHVEDEGTDLVSSHMSAAVKATTASATIMEAAREMCAEHIHRLIVLDEHSRPTGVISSLDLVAAMVKSLEE